MTDFVSCGGVAMASETRPLLERAGLRRFEDFMNFDGGRRICHKRGRSVFRFEIEGRAFYLKRNRIHRVELWKALTRLRLPKLGAMIEWENILALRDAGIPTVTPVAVGVERRCGLETRSFTLTEEIYGAEPLDELLRREFAPPLSSERRLAKRRLIRNLADLARRFHGRGMNHQDFYLNHFFLGRDGTFHLLDLQRVGRRSAIPRRYRIKDLAQLHYSTDYYGVGTRADRMRFFLRYCGAATLGPQEKALARDVLAKVRRIARHDVKLLARRRKRGELP